MKRIIHLCSSFAICSMFCICGFSYPGIQEIRTPEMVSLEPFVVLALGQSNMEGRYGSELDDESVPVDIEVWNPASGNFEPAKLGKFPFGGNAGGFGGRANNLVLRFAKRVREDTGRPVYIFLLAVGGKTIEYFMPKALLEEKQWKYSEKHPHKIYGNSLGDEIFGEDNEISKGLTKLGLQKVDVVLVHQGEANVVLGESKLELLKKYTLFVDEIRRMRYAKDLTPFLFGEINSRYPNAENQRDSIRLLSEKFPGVSVVKWDGIDEVGERKGSNGYNNHASGLGLQQLGDRYYEKFKSLEPSSR